MALPHRFGGTGSEMLGFPALLQNSGVWVGVRGIRSDWVIQHPHGGSRGILSQQTAVPKEFCNKAGFSRIRAQMACRNGQSTWQRWVPQYVAQAVALQGFLANRVGRSNRIPVPARPVFRKSVPGV